MDSPATAGITPPNLHTHTMKKLLRFGLTFAACSLTPLASAQQKNIPDSPPGTPGAAPQPADPARPDTGENADRDRDRKHEVAAKPTSEADFVKKAAKSGMAEVKVAQLGVEQAEDAKVKELAQMLLKDHTAANAALKPICDDMGIKPGDHADEKSDEKGEKKYKELKALTGKEFDTAFLEHMNMCHEKGIAWYEDGRKMAKAEPLVAYIDKTLPVLKAHHAKIRELHTGTRPDAGTTQSDDSKADAKRD